MCEDDEGFLYPAADENTCIECGLCEVVCPVIHVQPDVEKEQRAYLVQHKNEQVLRESTSGGAFTAIARWVLDRGGVVCGAGFSTDFEVVHQWANCYEDLRMFRNSKYVQSRIGNTYKEAKQFLMKESVFYSVVLLASWRDCFLF
ncbi:coenzyme F420 hydrogenase/dehydrogenase beta subunit N-terminal domain-containing protein [Bacteroides faecis]|uniref:coenzyme F420 hydrogenase/dehydrogenase beta subunit N-terminal domain-containing protein n=1 Tax=Bacteroides faecis TaxID=674529 RepID=UPI002165AE65|nr:coenzyme F420 hydrogenase/dehydrogenase beta subunit N-terminal domain-containing protein [Bacteroides faecis]MCS2936184.1 4Fe-4S binding protein [Bacteroides faecis]